MRTLYITRHAKSSWDDPRADDFHRPLNDRGQRDAPFMAQVFSSRNEPVDLLMSSTAVRALSTAHLFAKSMGKERSAVQEDRMMYLADLPTLIKRVEPVYPDIAREARVEGVVIIEAQTDIYGRVQSIKILRSIPLLDAAAADAVRQWVYEPMIINGRPRGVIFTVTVRFTLR